MLGDLSASYESNGDPAEVSSGINDPGGISYGAYQFASNMGVPQDFVTWLQNHTSLQWARDYGDSLAKYAVNSEEFKAEWHELGTVDRGGFLQLQHEYTKEKYYDKAVSLLRAAYFNAEKHSQIMQDVIWSRAVQYGIGNIVEMFEDALAYIPGYADNWNLSYVDEKRFGWDLINGIYEVCMTEEWNNTSNRQSLNRRYASERQDALSALEKEV